MKKFFVITIIVMLIVCSCSNNTDNGTTGSDTTDQYTGMNDTSNRQQDTTMLADSMFSIIIDTSDKQLRVVKGADTIKTYSIAVGTAKYPTPVGSFRIHQIDFNPDWTPPEGDWAKNKKPEKPGSKKNPMGRARIIYQMPYTIHGTKDLNSLGEAESHGSVRMANEQVIELARLIMEETGTIKPESWFQEVLADSTKMISVDLKRTVALTNRE
ncbi:MAG TPA: L,D-transpeptidase [Chitinophagaceae bacterium]|nr:L,D-transpeptidase [Chitinophagaceae bacterium]